jgi:transposase
VLAERMFPSTQICSRCGNRKEKDKKLALSDRIYYCDNKSCSGRHGIDRDANAAANLLQYGLEVLGELKLT